MTVKDDLHHLVDQLDEAATDELIGRARQLINDNTERLAEDERAQVELDEVAVTQEQAEPDHIVSCTDALGIGPLRADSLSNTQLAGELEGRTPLSLLSDVLNLDDNITVGLLAQAIVAHVLHGLDAKVMPTYFSWDLEIERTDCPLVRVEIKTRSTIQAWPPQTCHEPTAWGCGPIASMWDPGRKKFVIQADRYRPAHIYIFVRRHGDVFKPTAYTALVITTAELEALLGNRLRPTISKAALTREHRFVSLAELPAEVAAVLDRLPSPPTERPDQGGQLGSDLGALMTEASS